MSSWLQVNIKSTPMQIEALCGFVPELTGRGVEIIDENEEQWELVAFLDYNNSQQLRELNLFLEKMPEPYALNSKELANQDWHKNWRRNFSPFQLTEQIWIAPPWEMPETSNGKLVIIIDPGQAFGTGQHETTHLCLLHLQDLSRRIPPAMLDVGCGTGILGLAFLKLGGRQALAIDTDPLAREAARHNARLNNLPALMVSDKLLSEVDEPFPLITANITAQDLSHLAPRLAAGLTPGGLLICSGILQPQAEAVISAMQARGLQLLEQNQIREWVSLLFRKE